MIDRLIEVPNTFPDPGLLRLTELAGGFTIEQLAQLRDGTLGRPFLIDSGTLRHLL